MNPSRFRLVHKSMINESTTLINRQDKQDATTSTITITNSNKGTETRTEEKMFPCASRRGRKEAYRLRACFTCPQPPLLVLEVREQYVGSKRSHAVGKVPAEGSLSSRTRCTCPKFYFLCWRLNSDLSTTGAS